MSKTHFHIVLGLIFMSLSPALTAQEPDRSDPVIVRGMVEEGDTVLMMELPEVRIYQKKDFDYLYLKRRYRRLIRNVKKAYPYAQVAGARLAEVDKHLATLKSEKEQKAYIDQAEKEIMSEFEKEVRRLTVTQGIILVKLIDRETGRTSYQLIQELKGNISAFFWQGIARIFGNNLKAEYDPGGEDRIMEDIVRGIEAGFI